MYSRPKFWALLMLAGVLGILKDRPLQAFLLAGPILLAVAGSAMKQFPLGGRVCLFLIPILLLLFVAGARAVGSLIGRPAAVLAPLVLIPLAAISLARFPPTFGPEHLRPHLEYLSTRLERGDAVWVYYGAARVFDYYAGRLPIGAEISYGECDRTDPRANLRQLDTLRGRNRAWIVLIHAVRAEREAMLQYLNTIGELQDHSASREAAMPAGVYLYRLDDRERLTRADPATFAVPPIDDPSAWSCFGPVSKSPEGDRAAILALELEQK